VTPSVAASGDTNLSDATAGVSIFFHYHLVSSESPMTHLLNVAQSSSSALNKNTIQEASKINTNN